MLDPKKLIEDLEIQLAALENREPEQREISYATYRVLSARVAFFTACNAPRDRPRLTLNALSEYTNRMIQKADLDLQLMFDTGAIPRT